VTPPRELRVLIEGRPIPQGSKDRLGRRLVESSRLLRPWRARMAHEVGMEMDRVGWGQIPAGVAVRVNVMFYHPLKGRPLGDIDKLCRAVLDALSRVPIGAGVFHDDSQVEVLHAAMTGPDLAFPVGAARVAVSIIDPPLDAVPHLLAS